MNSQNYEQINTSPTGTLRVFRAYYLQFVCVVPKIKHMFVVYTQYSKHCMNVLKNRRFKYFKVALNVVRNEEIS